MQYANGHSVTYTHHTGRVTAISYDEGATTAFAYAYDASGKLQSMTDHLRGRVTSYSETGTEVRGLDEENTLYYSKTTAEDGTIQENFFGLELALSGSSSYDGTTGNTTTENNYTVGESTQTATRTEDALGRTIQKQVKTGETPLVNTDFRYRDLSETLTTRQIAEKEVTAADNLIENAKNAGTGFVIKNYSRSNRWL